MGETSFRQVFLYNDSVPAHLDFRAWYECPTWYDRTYSRGRSCSIDWLPIGGGKGRRVEDGGHGGGGGGRVDCQASCWRRELITTGSSSERMCALFLWPN